MFLGGGHVLGTLIFTVVSEGLFASLQTNTSQTENEHRVSKQRCLCMNSTSTEGSTLLSATHNKAMSFENKYGASIATKPSRLQS